MLDHRQQIKANCAIPEGCRKKRWLPLEDCQDLRHYGDKFVHNESKHSPREGKISKNRKQRRNGSKFNKLHASIEHSVRPKTSCVECVWGNQTIYLTKIGEAIYRNRQRYLQCIRSTQCTHLKPEGSVQELIQCQHEIIWIFWEQRVQGDHERNSWRIAIEQREISPWAVFHENAERSIIY